MLKEGIGDHRHEGMTMKSRPGSSFEVVKPELFLQLLMGLLTDPARLDSAGQCLDRRVSRQVREVVFSLPIGTTFSDQPRLRTGHVLATHVLNALPRSIGDPHAPRRSAPTAVLSCRGAS